MNEQKKGIRQFVIITGMSGAGKTATLKVLEDFGFITIDNLPPSLLPQLCHLLSDRQSAVQTGVVVTVDVRNVENPDNFVQIIEDIEAILPRVRLVFLNASDEELLRRYEKTRRVHPLSKNLSIQEGIIKERTLLAPLLEKADVVIDTSMMDLHQHRERLIKEFWGNSEARASLIISSFGFKFGVPQDSNYVLDVRFLPNPYYVDELRPLSGEDEAIRKYLNSFKETHSFLDHCAGFFDCIIPQYLNAVKTQLHIAVGCTGGRHRSVAVAEWLYRRYQPQYEGVSVIHRDKEPK